jgi:hypothetical protein
VAACGSGRGDEFCTGLEDGAEFAFGVADAIGEASFPECTKGIALCKISLLVWCVQVAGWATPKNAIGERRCRIGGRGLWIVHVKYLSMWKVVVAPAVEKIAHSAGDSFGGGSIAGFCDAHVGCIDGGGEECFAGDKLVLSCDGFPFAEVPYRVAGVGFEWCIKGQHEMAYEDGCRRFPTPGGTGKACAFGIQYGQLIIGDLLARFVECPIDEEQTIAGDIGFVLKVGVGIESMNAMAGEGVCKGRWHE